MMGHPNLTYRAIYHLRYISNSLATSPRRNGTNRGASIVERIGRPKVQRVNVLRNWWEGERSQRHLPLVSGIRRYDTLKQVLRVWPD